MRRPVGTSAQRALFGHARQRQMRNAIMATKISSLLIHSLFLFWTFCTAPAVAAASDHARLWKVTGPKNDGTTATFFILPVTHNGLEVEYDEYFTKTVLPIAMKADTYLSERSSMLPSEAPACANPLENTSENRDILSKARADVAK